MAYIQKSVVIDAPIHQVYYYVTNPDNWPVLFYPWSLKVEPSLNKPLTSSDPAIKEYAKVLGLSHDFTWTAQLDKAPNHFLMYGETKFLSGIKGYIRYDLEFENGRTVYT